MRRFPGWLLELWLLCSRGQLSGLHSFFLRKRLTAHSQQTATQIQARERYRRLLSSVGAAAGIATMGQVLSTRVASAAYGTGSGPGGSDLVTTDLAIQGKLALSGASGATPPSPTTTTIDAPGGNGFRIGTAAMSGGTNGWAAFGGNVWSDDLNWHAIDPSKRFSVLYCPAPYPEVMQIRQSLTPSDTVNTLARLYVSSGGNVGINTGMPQATLHVGGDLKVDGAFLGTASQAYYAP